MTSPWRATVLTLFPEMFPGPLGISLAGKALSAGLWALEARDIRDAATDRPRGDGADRRLRPAVAGRDGKTGVRRGRKLFRRAIGIPAIYPPATVRGPADPGHPQLRRPRPDRGLAPGRSRGPDQGEKAGSMVR